MFVKEILVSIFIVTVPNLVVTQFNFSDKLIYFVLGLTVGVDLGWWGYYFLSDSKTRRIKAEAERVTSEAERAVAETARLTEENAEKQRQWERDRKDRKEAEGKAAKEAASIKAQSIKVIKPRRY